MSMRMDEIEVTEDGLDAVIELCSEASGIRDVEQVAEHLAANALYNIEVNKVKKVVFDAKTIKSLID